MKTHTRLATLITFGAILGFMLAATSCGTAPMIKAQIALAEAQNSYEEKTNLTTGQTVGLLNKWWAELQQAREINKLLKSEPIPLGPIQATKASSLLDYTSAKAVLEGIHPQASLGRDALRRVPDSPPTAEPAPGPEPGTIRRSDAHHRLQIAAN